MIIDCISDLHGHYPKLQGGDLLIVAGDLTRSDKPYQYEFLYSVLRENQYRKIIIIAGNHDGCLESRKVEFVDDDKITYLCDSGTEFEYEQKQRITSCSPALDSVYPNTKKLKIWGSPWTLAFPGINPYCAAFTGTESELEAKFALIPSDVDILITHGPPIGFMDEVKRYGTGKIENCGSESLYLRLYKQEIRPKLHVFGHIHERYGHIPEILDMPGVQMVNCSHVNEHYKPVNKPIRVIL